MSSGSRKPKLRPSQDVLQRLRWDARFDLGSYLVVYRERGGGTKELAAPSFLESQRIPWSRVTAVRHREGDLIWDRERRLDRLFGSGETDDDDLLVPGSDGGAGFGIALDPWSFTEGAWRAGAPTPTGVEGAEAPTRPLRVLTWNLLFDRFSPERIQSAQRRPVQFRLLRESDADLIALQEVTPDLWAALLNEPWVREGYWTSDGPAGSTLDPSGQAILSRLPLEAVRLHAFSSRKQALVTPLSTGAGRLVVANLHLTSNRAERAPEIRREQLRLLTRQLQRAHPDDDWLILGDFNQGEGEPDGGLKRAGARDLWPELGSGPGHTYDPRHNALAAHFTGSGRSARFDRAYLRSRSDRWRGTRAELYATEEIPDSAPPLWASDHFALLVELTPGDGLAGEPVRTTALALIPPAALWGPLQELRGPHDDRISRWPPHVNLLFGFVPPERFAAAIARLEPLAREQAPLRLTLAEIQRFTQRREALLYAAPAPSAPLLALHSALVERFPGCGEARPFVPHLTLGRVPKSAGDAGLAAAWEQTLGRLSWEPDALWLLAREGKGAFTPRAVIPLGPPRSLAASLRDTGLVLSAAEELGRKEIAERLQRACLAEGALSTALLGSSALGVALRTSDLDLWAELPHACEAQDVWLEGLGERLVESAEVELQSLELVPAGESVQLRLLVSVESGAALRVDLQAGQGSSQAAAEADALIDLARGEARAEFLLGLRTLRIWARLRQFDRQAFGAWGGVAWAALTAGAWEDLCAGQASSGVDAEFPSAGELVVATFERLAVGGRDLGAVGGRDLGAAGGRDLGHHGAKSSHLGSSATPSLFARTQPTHDLARSLRPSVWRALRHEARAALGLARAAEKGTGAWSGILLPLSPPDGAQVRIHVELAPSPQATGDQARQATGDQARQATGDQTHSEAPGSQSLAARALQAEGWISGLAHELLRRLEASGAQPRAYPTPWSEPAGLGLELTWIVSLRGPLASGAWDRIAPWLERASRHLPRGTRASFELACG